MELLYFMIPISFCSSGIPCNICCSKELLNGFCLQWQERMSVNGCVCVCGGRWVQSFFFSFHQVCIALPFLCNEISLLFMQQGLDPIQSFWTMKDDWKVPNATFHFTKSRQTKLVLKQADNSAMTDYLIFCNIFKHAVPVNPV